MRNHKEWAMGKNIDSLGDRMKSYEAVSDGKLVDRVPVIIRIDGKAFHTLTKGINKPCSHKESDMTEQLTHMY